MFGTIFIIIGSISTLVNNSEAETNLWLIVIHLIFAVLALPFLLHSSRRANKIPIWFYRTIMVEAILNSIFLILTQNAVGSGKGPFYLFAVFELIPILLLQQNHFKLANKKFPIPA
ncbi:MAG: hypothetical protein HeimC2_24180 [Candidatus Heimdallarchaeota archaeon LC_2]|nr:MAG: hypothetical protein HeimC2_24180 [Candidatus Heimdallarchaeota archaeon LC_2]